MKKTNYGRFLKKVFLAFMVTFVCAYLLVVAYAGQNEENVIGKIGQYTIGYEELAMYAEMSQAAVAEKFAKEQQLESYGAAFWTKEYDGISPLESLATVVISELAYDKTIQKEAIKYGVTVHEEFATSQKKWQKLTEKKGTSLSLFDYINDSLSQEADQLKEKLYEKANPTEQELKLAYDSLEDDYKRSDYKVTGIELKFIENQFNEVEKKLSELKINSRTELIEQISKDFPNSIITAFDLNSQEIQKEDLYSLTLGEILFDKKEGVIVEGQQEDQYFYIISKEGGELLTYNQAPDLGKHKYINDLFEKHIKQESEKIDIETEKAILAALKELYKE